ncbi:MAG: hypothetical protein KGL53_05150 [Elusimicrobia bacterium]|nr:hypothetical protein [Elusimicrobiota bacterium]
MREALLAALSLAGAAGLYLGLERWGGADLRGWAAPGAAALAAGGVGMALNLPSWITVAAFLGVLFLFHKKARERLSAEAASVGRVEAEGGALEPAPAGEGRVAAWTRGDAVFSLEYAGEKDEDFVTTLSARAARFKPGTLVAQRAGVAGAASALLAGRQAVSELPGQSAAEALRCLPPDYAFAVLDFKTLSAVQELLQLSRADREVYAVLNGPEVKVVCQGLPGREDIRRMLEFAAVVVARLSFLGGQQVQ